MIRKYTKTEAIKEFKKLINKNKKNEAVKIGEVLLRKYINLEILKLITGLYIDINQINQGIRFYEEIDKLHDENIDIKKNLIKLNDVYIKDYKYIELKLNEILKINPNDVEAINSKLELQRITNKKDDAIQYINVINKNKKIKLNFNSYFVIGTIYHELNFFEEAKINYYNSIKLGNNNSNVYTNIASIYQSQGNIKKSNENYKKALKINKTNKEAFRSLAFINGINSKDRITQNIEYLIANNKINENLDDYAFGLSKIYDTEKNYTKAAKYLKIANKSKFQILKNQSNKELIQIKSIKRIYINDNYKGKIRTKEKEMIPIFIIGMPRTGSTLLEQILTMNKDVKGHGELKYLGLVTQKEVKRSKIKSDLISNYQDLWPKIGEKYIHQIKNNFGKSKFFIDKMPYNFINLGIIQRALPQSKIINLHRNKNDNLLSIYQNRFDEGSAYSYDIEYLKRYYNEYLDLMKFWDIEYKKNIYKLSYEDIVHDFNKTLLKLTDWLGINYTKKMESFYLNKKSTNTASNYQVRQELNTKGIDKYKNYINFLPDLFK